MKALATINQLTEDSDDARRKDAQAHAAIWAKLADMDPNDPEFLKLWAEAERIKNKYKGFVPTMESRGCTPLSYLEMLDWLASEDPDVRQQLAAYPRALPLTILLALARDEDAEVRRFVAQRDQKLPWDVLDALIKHGDQLIWTGICNNQQKLPPATLKQLAELGNFGVDSCLMSRGDLPLKVIEMLANSSNVYVKGWANGLLRKEKIHRM